MKYLKRLSLGVLTLISAVVLIFFFANVSDDSLDPRALELLNDTPKATAQGTKAFYYLLGVRAGDPEHAEATGERLWKAAFTSADVEEQSKQLAKTFKNDNWPSIKFAEREGALSEQWKTRPEIREAVEGARAPIAQYIKLLSYGEISTLNPSDFIAAGAMSPQMIFKGHKLFRHHLGELAANGKFSEAENLIRQEAHMAHNLLTGNTLLMTMIAAVILHNDAVFLSDEIKLNPKLKVHKETLTELQLPGTNVIKEAALKTEMRYFHSVLPILKKQRFKSFIGEDAPWFTRFTLARWLLLPNESVNKYYSFLRETLAHQCPDSLDTCYEAMRWAIPQYPWDWIRNPTGKSLFKIFAMNLGGRFQKLDIRKKQIDALIVELAAHTI